MIASDLNMRCDIAQPHPRQLHTYLRAQPEYRQNVRFATCHRYSAEGLQLNSGSTIDHVWSPFPCRCTRVASLASLSDHQAVRISHAHANAAAPPHRRQTEWRRAWRRMPTEAVAEKIRGSMTAASCPLDAWEAAGTDIKRTLVPRR